MKFLVKLIVSMCLFFPVSALAELPKQVALDFAVLSGYVVMPINQEYLVDLDARDHLAVGDILTLVIPGKKIYHPVTKEVLGSVDTPVGYLQVTRINSGYSYAKLLTSDVEPQNGAQVRRFEQVPARFVDNKDDGGGLARQLQMDLPQFKWLQEGASEQPLLTFVLKADSLLVKTAGDNLLHKYAVTDNHQLAAPAGPALRTSGVRSTKPEPKLLEKAAGSVLSVLNLGDDNDFMADAGIIRQNAASLRGVWLGPNIEGNPVGVAVADLDGDGQQEIAVALDSKLLIGQVSQGKYVGKAEVAIPAGRQILSLDAADLDNDGRPELYLTAVAQYELASFVVQYTGSDYALAVNNVKWYLRVVELPGQQHALIGQAMGHEKQSFLGNPFHVRLEDNRLVRGDEIVLPGLVNIYSFLPFTDDKNNLIYVYLTMGDYLKVVSAEGVELWESSEYFGGSETCFDNRKGHDGDTVVPTCIQSRLVKTPGNEILVAQNDGQRLMQRYRKFKESRILSMNWNGFAMEENWRTVGQKGYLGDYALADADNDGKNELVMAVKFKHAGYIDKARSAIVLYELN